MTWRLEEYQDLSDRPQAVLLRRRAVLPVRFGAELVAIVAGVILVLALTPWPLLVIFSLGLLCAGAVGAPITLYQLRAVRRELSSRALQSTLEHPGRGD